MTENNPIFVLAFGHADMVYFSFFYGVTSIFIVIHLLLSLFIREKLSLFYCIYLFFLTLAIALGNGHVILLEELNKQFFCFFMVLTAIASLYISFQLLTQENVSKTGFIVIFFIVILAPACMLLPTETSYLIIIFLFSAIIIYRMVLSFRHLKTVEAQLFLAGTFSALICVIIFETSSISQWIIVGAMLEMIFTSLIIGSKIKSTIERNALLSMEGFQSVSDNTQITNKEQTVLIPEMDANDKFIIQSLTSREMEVLSLLAEGLKDDELASSLKLSVPTIKTHLRNLYSKLNVRSRTEASIKYNNLLTMNK